MKIIKKSLLFCLLINNADVLSGEFPAKKFQETTNSQYYINPVIGSVAIFLLNAAVTDNQPGGHTSTQRPASSSITSNSPKKIAILAGVLAAGNLLLQADINNCIEKNEDFHGITSIQNAYFMKSALFNFILPLSLAVAYETMSLGNTTFWGCISSLFN